MADIVDRIKAEEIRWLKLHVLDPEGFLRGFGVNAHILSERPLKKGFKTSKLSLAFGKEEEELVVVPIEDTYAIIPWEDRSARLLSYIVKENGGAYAKDPYHALKRALAGMEALGLSFRAKQRIEFYLLENVVVDRVGEKRGPSATVDSRETPWNPNTRYIENRAAAAVPFDMYGILREQMGDVLNLYYSTPILENGHSKGMGQQYFTIGLGEGMRVAFDAINVKFVSKMVAMLNGAFATFMPYPIKGEKPSFWELEIELWKGKGPTEDELFYFVGGILEHIESLTIFTNPTTNSYRALKLQPKYGVATTKEGGVVRILEEGNKTIVRLTFLDPSANPYLALAAVIGAGIDGLKNKTTPDVLEENPNKMTSRERAKAHIKELPTSLSGAVKALNKDNDYLKGIFTPDLLAHYLEKKLLDERENQLSPTYFELKKYIEM